MNRFERAGLVVLAVCLPFLTASRAAEPGAEPPKLLGRCTPDQLDQEPFSDWYSPGRDDYAPDPDVTSRLRRTVGDDVRVLVFFGTWCGDSRREVPRLVKLLDTIGFPQDRLELVAVDNVQDALKRSPGGEERGREVYRVPTIIVLRNEAEVSRIVEHPVLSLERDLLAILAGDAYEPSYASYPLIRQWLSAGLLADPNVSARGLAGTLRHLVATEGELAAAGRVLLDRGDIVEAVKLFEANCDLYDDSPGCRTQLAKALLRAGEPERAAAAAEKALRLGPGEDEAADLVELIQKTADEKH